MIKQKSSTTQEQKGTSTQQKVVFLICLLITRACTFYLFLKKKRVLSYTEMCVISLRILRGAYPGLSR